jgi:1,4-dihydroxy-2-naphthoyl-CoA synthase
MCWNLPEIARDFCVNCAVLPAGLQKHLLWRALAMDTEELAGIETLALVHTMSTPDAVEDGLAYMERRTPQWTASINTDWRTG